jgi:hypothetical protein
MRCLIEEDAFAGQWALEKVLKKYYLHLMGIRRSPWPTVLREFNDLLKSINGSRDPKSYKTYKWINKGGRRYRLRVYRIPSMEELTPTSSGQEAREPGEIGYACGTRR